MQLKRALFNFCQTSYKEPGWKDVGKCSIAGVAAGILWYLFGSAAYYTGVGAAKFFMGSF